MATLVSPGAEVTIINESFYGSPGVGTVPLIILATASNKAAPSGGIAELTLPNKAGELFLATSQRELVQGYGVPKFYTSGGTSLHGHELNEYGLHATYSYFGIANRAYTLRADIDLAQLDASDSAPRGDAVSGTFWLDLSATKFGVKVSNGSTDLATAWEDVANFKICGPNDIDSNVPPQPTGGNDGDFAVVPLTTANLIYEKINNAWYRVGSTAWKAAKPTVLTAAATSYSTPISPGQTLIINGTTITASGGGWANAAAVAAAITGISGITASAPSGRLVLTNTTGGDITIGAGTANTAVGLTAGVTKGVTLSVTNDAQYPAGSVAGDVWVKLTKADNGADWGLKRYNGIQWATVSAPFFEFDSSKQNTDVTKDAAARAFLQPSVGTLYIGYDATGVFEPRRYDGSKFVTLVYEASLTAPDTGPEDGTLWFSADLRVDIMVGNGTRWEGYQNRFAGTDPAGVIISGSTPSAQSTGDALVDGDLWLNSSDLENYPALYRWSVGANRWGRIDNTDNTTPAGIVFADARADSGIAFTGMPNSGDYSYSSEDVADMLVSDYLDPDAPDPRLYPSGVLLFNTRYSTYNVKVWRPEYFRDGGYDANTDYTNEDYTVGSSAYEFAPTTAGRWVTASGNKVDGSPYMGRKAQRIMVVRAMAEAVASNEDIRSETVFFNLIAAPGYPELIDELVTLNTDMKEIAFIVADTPARLNPKGMAIQQWATNAKAASGNGEDGLTSASPYVGVYYPWGLSTNSDGQDVMVPPSTIALRTIAYNDQVAYPWFAPAGYQRGLVQNASAVGYLDANGEFVSVSLSQGQRDVLYTNKINAIAYMNGAGLVVYGQKTLDAVASALDRINVARLTNYIRFHINNLVEPFLFQPNDAQTRDGARRAVERFLAGIVGLRGISDFAVLCDLSNNTPERIDRNELWIDVAILPVKAVEFIYVPVRIRDTESGVEL